MRIAIVNDTFMAVEVLQRIVSSVPEYKVAWVAYDGIDAVYKCAADTPDLILMDVVMPGMNGVEATRQIMSHSPCAILMVTASVNRYTADVFEAMGYGALDAVNTPVLIQGDRKDDSMRLLKKIATIARLLGKSYRQEIQRPQQKSSLIVMGASTGGPQALVTVLSQFPKDFQAAVVIVQHVDAQFAPGFANWLNSQIPMLVKMAVAGSPPQSGQVLIAGGNLHLTMHSDLTLGYHKQPLDCLYCPSVDVFFESVATHWTGRGVGVLLTGMGRDGARGLKKLRTAGWHTIAQDRETSVVYGMPKAAAELEAATEILPLNAIASGCCNLVF